MPVSTAPAGGLLQKRTVVVTARAPTSVANALTAAVGTKSPVVLPLAVANASIAAAAVT